MIALTISATPAAAQSPARSLWLPSLRELLAAYDVPLVQGAPPDLEQHVPSYAVEDAADLFVIGFHPASRATTALPETLHVSAFDRRARTWAHARLQRHRQGAPAWDAGAVVKIHHTDRHVLLDTHHSPSAGTVVVLSRRLAPVTALAGWVRRILPSGVILYQRSSIHFAPTHSVELWTWDESSVRDVRLYPGTTSDSLRRAYVDTVRAIYRRAGEAWFRTNNHHMDPERFDSRLYDSVVVGESGRTLAFLVRFGGGEGTPVATPVLDVVVQCRDVGLEAAHCTEQPLSRLERRHPGRPTSRILNDLVLNRSVDARPSRRDAVTLEPLVGARVRFRTGLGTPWRNGMLNQTRTVPACFMVLLWSGGRLRRTQVPLDSIGALQVSSLYAIARRYEEPDTTAGAAEQWLDVPAEMMGAAAARCGRMYR